MSVILQLVGRPVCFQFIDLFSLFFILFSFTFQLQCLVGNVVQLVGRPISQFNLLTYFSIYSFNDLFIFCISTAVSGGRCSAVVGRPISLQFINLFLLIYSLNNLFFIDLFSLFFNSFTFIFQLQYPVGNAVQ